MQVKNLDAELVLDVVAKKMFDNFSMWQLQLKKMSQCKEKGLKVIDQLFQDTENVLAELKKLIDNCLTDTKLCDDPCPSINMGEYLQVHLTHLILSSTTAQDNVGLILLTLFELLTLIVVLGFEPVTIGTGSLLIKLLPLPC